MPKHHRSPPSLKRQHSTGLHQVHHNRRGTWAGQKVDAEARQREWAGQEIDARSMTKVDPSLLASLEG